MSGAAAVVALVLLEWTAGMIGTASWTQSWSVVRRGHFRIVAWTVLALALLGTLANNGTDSTGAQPALVTILLGLTGLHLGLQYLRADLPAVLAGSIAGIAGVSALAVSGGLLAGWNDLAAALLLAAGALLLGSVTNGMLLGHWYLNQPGLKPWALKRLTDLCLVATVASGMLGLASVSVLARASTEGAALGIPGFGEAFGVVFYLVWIGLVIFTAVVVVMARRCIQIRSIQSATGLYYVALLTAGVAQFLVTYLMVNAA